MCSGWLCSTEQFHLRCGALREGAAKEGSMGAKKLEAGAYDHCDIVKIDSISVVQ